MLADPFGDATADGSAASLAAAAALTLRRAAMPALGQHGSIQVATVQLDLGLDCSIVLPKGRAGFWQEELVEVCLWVSCEATSQAREQTAILGIRHRVRKPSSRNHQEVQARPGHWKAEENLRIQPEETHAETYGLQAPHANRRAAGAQDCVVVRPSGGKSSDTTFSKKVTMCKSSMWSSQQRAMA